MPKFLPPNHVSAHRIAAIALYRALLTESRAAPISPPQRAELCNVIKARFKQWRNQQSTKRLRVAFVGGYQALDKLDAANAGDEESAAHILDLLSEIPDKYKQAPVRPQPVKQAVYEGPRRSMLDRPLPLSQLTGRRHVPRLISANQIPVLRIKKPQPENLSGYLRKRIKRRQMRTDLEHDLEESLPLASTEDAWDQQLARDHEQHGDGVRWTDALDQGITLLVKRKKTDLSKNKDMARKMQDIVDKEQKLLVQERHARRAAARERRQREQRSASPVESNHAADSAHSTSAGAAERNMPAVSPSRDADEQLKSS